MPDNFDPNQWLAKQTSISNYDIDAIRPAMWFALIWNRFELRICDRDASISSIESSLLEASDAGILHWKDFEVLWDALKAYLVKEGALNNLEYFLLSDKRKNQKEADYVKVLLPILQEHRPEVVIALRGMLFIAYRIRNNLFHGEKCITSLPRQCDLFSLLNAFIAKYIDITKD